MFELSLFMIIFAAFMVLLGLTFKGVFMSIGSFLEKKGILAPIESYNITTSLD